MRQECLGNALAYKYHCESLHTAILALLVSLMYPRITLLGATAPTATTTAKAMWTSVADKLNLTVNCDTG